MVALGTIAVIGHQPVAGQHAVVGLSMPMMALAASAATWSMGLVPAGRATLMGVSAVAAMFAAAALWPAIPEAWLTDGGGHTAAPVFFLGAALLAVVGAWLRAPWWLVTVGASVHLALFLVAARWWDSGAPRGMLLGGAVIGGLGLLVFASVGCLHHAVVARRTPLAGVEG